MKLRSKRHLISFYESLLFYIKEMNFMYKKSKLLSILALFIFGASFLFIPTAVKTTNVGSVDVYNNEPPNNPTPGTPFEAQNESAFTVMAENKYQIKTQSGFNVQLRLNLSANITITEFNQSKYAMTQNQYQVRTKTMAIEVNDSSIQIQANLSYTFTNQKQNQFGIKNIEKLQFMFYNETSSAWEAPKNQWLEEETLYCNTTHFSLWTIAEDESSNGGIPGFTFLGLTSLIIVSAIVIRRRYTR